MPWLVNDGTSIELTRGETRLGRSKNCDIVVSDGLASRLHTSIMRDGEDWLVRDEDSRNGTLLNGEATVGAHRLNDGDRVTIGRQQYTFRINRPPSAQPKPRTRDGGNLIEETLDASDEPPTNTSTATGLSVIGTLIARSLDAGDQGTAGKLLKNLATRVMTNAEHRDVTSEELVLCSSLALDYAERTHDSRWISWVFDLHGVLKTVPIASTVDRLCDLGAEIKLDDAEPIRRWLRAVANKQHSPAERFLINRIESLERVVSA